MAIIPEVDKFKIVTEKQLFFVRSEVYASDLFSALFCYQFMLAQSLKFVPVFVPMGTTATIGVSVARSSVTCVHKG